MNQTLRVFRVRLVLRCLVASALGMATSVSATTLPFEFAAFGSFKRFAHTGDASPKVSLSRLPQTAGQWGVGALAGMKGEVLLFDGHLLVSRGSSPQGRATPPEPGEEATLLAMARVERWRDILLPIDMTRVQFDAFVLAQAESLGIDTRQAFPLRVSGRYPRLVWHVVTGMAGGIPASSPHGTPGGHANQRTGMHRFDQPDASGWLVGVYSGNALEGVVSHPGDRFHLHYADETLSVSGHVDSVSFAKDSILKLPLR